MTSFQGMVLLGLIQTHPARLSVRLSYEFGPFFLLNYRGMWSRGQGSNLQPDQWLTNAVDPGGSSGLMLER